MHCSLCFFALFYWIKFCSCFRKVIFIWKSKKWSLVALDSNHWKGIFLRGLSIGRFNWVQMFKCIISHSSTKSMVLPLHKFTIRKLDLLFTFFGKLNSLDITVYLLKKIVPQESRIAFCQLFIARVKEVCYETKVQGELLGKLLGSYFHCTLERLHPQVPTTSFRLMATEMAECQCYNETQTSHPVNSKTQQKNNIIFHFLLCQVRLILFNTNLITKTIFHT